MDPMDMFDFLIIIGIERVHIVDADMKNVIISTVHHETSAMDAPPKMFVGAAILRVHAFQDTGHMNTRLAAPHTDCGIQYFPGQP